VTWRYSTYRDFFKAILFNPWDPRRSWWGMENITPLCQLHTALRQDAGNDGGSEHRMVRIGDQEGVEGKTARPKQIRALETLLHCRRQQLIRMAASRRGTLKLDHIYEWVCSSNIAEIDKDMIVQGHYHIIPMGEKREYGELHLRKLHDDYEIVVENNTAKGQSHELPALVQGTTTETALVTDSEEPTEMVQDPIVSDGTSQY
jgi:hypothetical protein